MCNYTIALYDHAVGQCTIYIMSNVQSTSALYYDMQYIST